jgi:hypothetical protein
MLNTPTGLLAPKVGGRIPTDGLVVYYKFDNDLLDSSGNGYNAGASNISYVTDRHSIANGALRFDNALGSILTCPTFPGLSTEGSLVLWIKNDYNTPPAASVAGGPALAPVIDDCHYPYTNGKGYFYTLRNVASGRVNNVTLSAVDRANWHMLAITQTPGTNGYKIYQNASLIYQTNGASGIHINDTKNLLSRRTIAEVDDYIIYDRVLAPEEITGIYDLG